MEKIDPVVAARVWQRVTAAPKDIPPLPMYTPPAASALGELIALSDQAAAVYLQLYRRFTGRDAALLKDIAAKKQQQTACLKGLRAISGSGDLIPQLQPPGRETPKTLLQRCYGWETKLLQFCQARTEDPSQGHIYSHLARQQKEMCVQLLALLGRQK